MSHVSLSMLAMVAFGLTFLLGLNGSRICRPLLLMDVPSQRKQHKYETPLVGGLAFLLIFVPLTLTAFIPHASDRWIGTQLIWMASVAAMALVGIADDRHSLSPKMRLLFSFSVFGLAAIMDPSFNVRVLDFEQPEFTLGLGTRYLAVLFTVICCVGLINAVNMADGKNGLVIGLAIGWTGLLATRAPAAIQPGIVLLIAVLACLLVFNMKGLLFLGDGGAYGVATAVGMLAIIVYNTPGDHALRSISADELVLLFFVPVADSFRLTFVRLRRGQSPMAADRDHLHHHLGSWAGWPGGLFLYYLIAFLPAAIYFSHY